FVAFTQEFRGFDELKQLYANRLFLLRTSLFGEMLSFPVQNHITRIMNTEEYPEGTDLVRFLGEDIFIIAEGGVDLAFDGVSLGSLKAQDFLGAEGVLFGTLPFYTAVAEKDVRCYRVPGSELKGIPIIQLKLLENFKKMIGVFLARYSFRWQDRYPQGEKGALRELFRQVENVSAALRESGDRKRLARSWNALAGGFRAYRPKGEEKRILEDIEAWNERISDDNREIDTDFLEYLTGRVAACVFAAKDEAPAAKQTDTAKKKKN
ncbi:MAG: hypothetical protein FWG35_07030, partial [Spirochaetaceae bacterium]|nr:hypothetical protein [Spirochaetaceae bacterium]